jgi:hypothetical protein
MFIWQIKTAMAAKFISDLKAKVARGFTGKFAKGEYLTCPPLGYKMKDGKLVCFVKGKYPEKSSKNSHEPAGTFS